MQFQVNGEDYFLKFVEDENRFYVFRSEAVEAYLDSLLTPPSRAWRTQSRPTTSHRSV